MPASDRLEAVKGRFIHLPLNAEQSFNQLNQTSKKSRSLADIEDYVLVYGMPKKDTKIWKFIIDYRINEYSALKVVIEINPNNSEFEVPEQEEDFLPDVFCAGSDGDIAVMIMILLVEVMAHFRASTVLRKLDLIQGAKQFIWGGYF